jgi:hypothetical protein
MISRTLLAIIFKLLVHSANTRICEAVAALSSYSCTTHARNGTNRIAVVHSCKLRKPNLYEGLEIKLYEGLGISFEIRVVPE